MAGFDLSEVIDLLKKADELDVILSYEKDELVVKVNREKKPDSLFLNSLRDNKAHLVEYFRQYGSTRRKSEKAEQAIPLRDRAAGTPLSFAQDRLWFMDRMQGSRQFHLHWLFTLRGQLDVAALESAFRTIIDRHEVLRTVIHDKEGKGCPELKDARDWQMHIVDRNTLRQWGYEDAVEYIKVLLDTPFRLTSDFMLKVTLVETGDNEYLLSNLFHHIAFDGWSISIMVKELVECYSSHIENRAPSLPVLPVQYSDYAAWQRTRLHGALLESKLSYWRKHLEGVTPSAMPTDFPRPLQLSTRGGTAEYRLSPALAQQLQQLARNEGATLFMTMLAAFKVLLYRYSQQEDICVGTPLAGRQYQELENLVGFFVNTLALRSTVNRGQSFRSFLQEVKQHTLMAYEHQDVPFEKIVQASGEERDPGRSPVFQVVFALHNTPAPNTLRLGDLELDTRTTGAVTIQYDLDLNATETPEGIDLLMVYSSDLYKASTIKRLFSHYEQLLQSIVAGADTPVGQLQIMSGPEKQQVLYGFDPAPFAYPSGKTVTALFAEQVQRTPGAAALIMGEERVTYAELDERSNRLAHYLIHAGVQPGNPVALLAKRGTAMITAIWGILKAGGIYVPLNTDYPAERLKYIINDAGVSFVVYTNAHLPGVYGLADHEHLVDLNDSEFYPSAPLAIDMPPQAGVYIMYTSGTTGNPKGTLVTHNNIVKLVYDPGPIRILPDDRVLQWSNYAFDGSVYDIFGSLLSGATLCPIDDIAADVYALGSVITRQEITVAFFTTALFNSFADACPEALTRMRKILFGGEMVSVTHVRKMFGLLGPGHIVHVYGPTETTVYATIYAVDAVEDEATIPIGKPLANTTVVLLDAAMEPVPAGVPGELYIGGDGVSAGYVSNEPLTAARFIHWNGKRYYRTGDLVRRDDTGNIIFCGRADGQVKMRGYRIELGEIEAVLMQCEEIQQAVVLLHTDEQQNKRLAAFVVPGDNYDKQHVLTQIEQRLPDYMIPSVWTELQAIPLTPNGKVNRRQLAEVVAIPVAAQDYVAPRTATEETLAGIWKELLDLERVGIYDDFFELGGHSLMAIRVLSAIRTAFGKELAIREMFDSPTIAALSALINTNSAAERPLPPITAVSRPERVPLSYGQERLWFMDRLQGSVQFHMPWVFRVRGGLNVSALDNAFRTIVGRHEVLRTAIREEEGKGYQYLLPGNGWQMQYSNAIQAQRLYNGNWQRHIQELVETPFDLANDYMLRVNLIEIAENEYILSTLFHHIAFDGWSIGIMVKELVSLYNNNCAGTKIDPAPLPIQYADYAIWQRTYLTGHVLQQKLDYWVQQLRDTEPCAMLTDFPRPARQSTKGGYVHIQLGKALYNQLQQLAQEEGATLFMLLIAAAKVLLHRYTGQEDICIGTPNAGRNREETEGIIGFFVNTLALRSTVHTQQSFRSLLQQVRQCTLQAYEHQDVPFEKIVDALGIERDPARSPVFQVVLALHNTPPTGDLRFGDAVLNGEPSGVTTAKYDLDFDATANEDGLFLSLTYCSDLYRAGTMQRLLQHFNHLLQSIVTDADGTIGQLPIVSEAAQEQLLNTFNNTSFVYPADKTVVQLFTEQVQRRPMAVALVMGEEMMTYQQLDERSNQLAQYLILSGVQPGNAVALLAKRGTAMLVAIWGILKAGGIYVPLNTDYPAGRLKYIVKDAAASHIVYTDAHLLEACGLTDQEHAVDLFESEYMPVSQPVVSTSPRDGVYIMYTSGTTGNPKGTLVTHTNIVKLVSDPGAIRILPEDRVLQWSNYAFDGSVYDIFGSLLNGASLHLIGDIAADVYALGKVITGQQITVSFFTAALFNSFADVCPGVLTGMRRILAGGEQLSVPHVRKMIALLGPGRIVNGYGPTETTVFAATHAFDHIDDGAVPIGKPLANTRIVLLDAARNPVPAGVPGEIYIGGDGVSAGYVNNDTLNAARFVQWRGERYYRTGDLARWDESGNIFFTGRADGQIKMRGYRIEPGEIEAILLQCAGVHQAVVLLHTDEQQNKRLAGFIVTGSAYNKTAMQAVLQQQLPDYMIPSVWMELPEMPLTPNGKVDRRRLLAAVNVPAAEQGYVPPRTPEEKTLAEIWCDLLDIEQVGIYDDFFELGGHSLLAIRVLSAIRTGFGKQLAIRDMFDSPTIAGLSALISGNAIAERTLPPIQPGMRPEQLPLSYGQERLWFIDHLHGSIQYHMPWMFRLKGTLDIDALEKAFQSIVNRHEVLRTGILGEAGKGYQVILPENGWKIDYLSLDEAASGNITSAVNYLQSVVRQPMAMATEHKLRVSIVQVAGDEYLMLTLLHHIAFDGWSIGIMVGELVELYRSLREQRQPVLKPLPIQYADYAAWQRRHLAGEVLAAKLAYWKTTLTGVPPSALITDLPRPPKQSTRGRKVYRTISPAATAALNELSRQEGATLFMTLLTAFNVLLYRYTGQDDLCMGTPVAGRHQQEVEGLIGFFVNTLILRNRVNGSQSFRRQLQQVRQQTLAAYEHQEVSFEKVVETLGLERDLSRSPVFQVTFAVGNMPEYRDGLDLTGMTLTPENPGHGSFQFDIGLNCIEGPDGLLLELTYCRDLFYEDTMDRLLGHYSTLLHHVLTDADILIDGLQLNADADTVTLPENDLLPAIVSATITEAFARQTSLHADDIAVREGDTFITYRELCARTNRLANYLCSTGLGPGTNVAVLLPPGTAMLIAVMGVQAAGAVPVPLHPAGHNPAAAINDADAGMIITSGVYAASWQQDSITVIDIDRDAKDIDGSPDTPPVSTLQADDIAVIMYTGNGNTLTGMPVSYRALLRSLAAQADAFGVMAGDCLAQGRETPVSKSITIAWLALLHGAQLSFLPVDKNTHATAIGQALITYGVTQWFTRGGLLAQLPPRQYGLLKKIVLPVQDCSHALVEGWKEKVMLFSEYEAPQAVTALINRPGNGQDYLLRMPMGKPLPGVEIQVPDASHQPAGIDVPGRLYIKHTSMPGRGWLDTHDAVRRKADGSLEWLGAVEEEIVINQSVINTRWVEAVLHEAPGVRQAVVKAVTDQEGLTVLAAYMVCEELLDTAAITAYCNTILPQYMIPGHFTEIGSIPLHHDGSIARSALPATINTEKPTVIYEAPATPLEEELTGIWQELLGADGVGVHDNFFDRGGYSIVMIQLLSQMTGRGYDIQLGELYSYQTIRKQAGLIMRRREEAEAQMQQQMNMALPVQAERNHCITFHTTGKGQPIFILPGSTGLAHAYGQLAAVFHNICPVYGLHMEGIYPGEQPGSSMESIAALNIQRIKAVQPEGPYRFIGHSFGGHVAFEMCRQLEAAGEVVEWVSVLDIAAVLEPIAVNNSNKVGIVLSIAAEIFEANKTLLQGYAQWGAALEAALAGVELPQMAEAIRSFLAQQGLQSPALDQLLAMLHLRIYNMQIRSQFEQPVTAPLVIAKAAAANWSNHSALLGWEAHSTIVQSLTLPGDHHSISSGAGAEQLQAFLAEQGYC